MFSCAFKGLHAFAPLAVITYFPSLGAGCMFLLGVSFAAINQMVSRVGVGVILRQQLVLVLLLMLVPLYILLQIYRTLGKRKRLHPVDELDEKREEREMEPEPKPKEKKVRHYSNHFRETPTVPKYKPTNRKIITHTVECRFLEPLHSSKQKSFCPFRQHHCNFTRYFLKVPDFLLEEPESWH